MNGLAREDRAQPGNLKTRLMFLSGWWIWKSPRRCHGFPPQRGGLSNWLNHHRRNMSRTLQAGINRGGRSKGEIWRDSANSSAGWVKDRTCSGAIKSQTRSSGGNSTRVILISTSDFFSEFFPRSIALHKGHGCWPSKVLVRAVGNDSARRCATSIPAHAADCSTNHCPPVNASSMASTRIRRRKTAITTLN